MNKELLKTRKYQAGYEVRDELWWFGEDESHKVLIKSAYTPNGDYIGDSKWAYRLCKVRGVKPEKSQPGHSVCLIGFCEERQTWAGWSHRAYHEFGVGSKVKKGDCGYCESTYDEMVEVLSKQYLNNDYTKNVVFEESPDHKFVIVHYDAETCEFEPAEISDDGEVIPMKKTDSRWETFTDSYQLGRGEWEAQTLEDAKQMAIDFVEGVS